MFVIVSDIFSAFNISSHRATDRPGGKGNWTLSKRLKYSNKTVTLIQQSNEYSHAMDN